MFRKTAKQSMCSSTERSARLPNSSRRIQAATKARRLISMDCMLLVVFFLIPTTISLTLHHFVWEKQYYYSDKHLKSLRTRAAFHDKPDNVVSDASTTTAETDDWFLTDLLNARDPKCEWKRTFGPNDDNVTYLAVARAASTTLQNVLQQHAGPQHHNHDCTLKDLQALGVKRVAVVLRHPLARISSGVSRRLEGHLGGKPANQIFCDNFQSADEYILALMGRNRTHPKLHEAAVQATLGRDHQNYMLPVSEYYLAKRDDDRTTTTTTSVEIGFLCMDSLQHDFTSLAKRWGLHNDSMPLLPFSNRSNQSSADAAEVLSHFSSASIQWVLRTYAADVALYAKHCPKGFQSYEHLHA